MTDEPIPDADLDAIVAELERAGPLQTYTRADGQVGYRLTPQGARVGRALAMAGEDGAMVLDALLDATES